MEPSWLENIESQLKTRNAAIQAIEWVPTLEYANKRTEFYKNRAQELAKDISKAQVEELKNKCDSQTFEIQKTNGLNAELMVMIGQLKETNVELKNELLSAQKKITQLQEEAQISKKALELANDHLLELQMENNLMMSSTARKI